MHKQFIVGDRTQTIHSCSPDVSVAILAQVFVLPNFHVHRADSLLFDHGAREREIERERESERERGYRERVSIYIHIYTYTQRERE